jgi:hypothetical protein
MGVQTGIFARLTWVEYSWDIVEPCTYFATYFTVFATFGYYIFTKQVSLLLGFNVRLESFHYYTGTLIKLDLSFL